MTKRLERLAAWIEANPYRVYADYRDCISNEQAAMLLAGEFDEFDESIWQWEINASDYVDWSDWESEFATAAGYDEFDEMPEWLQEFASDNRHVDCSDLIETAIGAWSGHVAATLQKRNGDLIEFPCYSWGGYDASENARLNKYLREQCGIDGRTSEATYCGTYLKAIGTVDLLAIWKSGVAPTAVYMTAQQTTIGHEPMNGSGTCGTDQYKGRDRWMAAEFQVDELDRYGIDSVFGLSGHMWRDEMHVR